MKPRPHRVARRYLRSAEDNRHFEQVLNMTEEDFAANPPPGFSYNPRASWNARRPERGHTVLAPGFFRGDRDTKTYVLYHEVGHDLLRDFNRDWKDVLEPHRLDRDTNPKPSARSTYDNPYGFSERPEEMIADVYASLFTGGEKWYTGEKYQALFRQARKLAQKFGLPLP